MSSKTSALRDERRAQLSRARLMLLFTPDLCPPGRDPFEVLERALPHLDVIQVRIKDPELGTSPARAIHDCALRVLELVERCASRAQVLVNDRVDVAAVLAPRGLVGVHVGADDVPPSLAREQLGEDALIGLSTHTGADVALAAALPVDYLGFGPVHATTTRGYARGLGAEAAWVASCASAVPVFPIGGIDASNAGELTAVGRAAVSSAILGAEDPAATAAAIRAALEADD